MSATRPPASDADDDARVARARAADAGIVATDDEVMRLVPVLRKAREAMKRLRDAIDAEEQPAAVFQAPRER